jgi:H+/Cl- antiporter ClcA
MSASAGTTSMLRPHYLRLLVGSVLIAVPAAVVSYLFVKAFQGLADLLWDVIPDALGANPGGPWTLLITVGGGLAVGALVRYSPGHAGPGPADGHGVGGDDDGTGGESQDKARAIPGLVVAAIVSLACGASLGPEMPLFALLATVGGAVALALRLPADMVPTLALASIASMLGAIFGSPVAGAILYLEMAPFTGNELYVRLMPALLASTAGFATYKTIAGAPFASFDLPTYAGFETVDVLWALGIGVAGSLVGIALIYGFRALDSAIEPLRDRPILLGALGGLGIGCVALGAGELTLFSGEHEIEELLAHPESTGTLLLLAGGKLIAIAISLATGFRGGRVFPLFFVGAALGLALVELTSVPPALAVACGMVSVGIPAMRLPLFMILIVAFFTSAEVLPLIVISGVAAYVVCHDRPELRDAPQHA